MWAQSQVLSSRQDLLPTPYVKELETLQDSVPPFDDAISKTPRTPKPLLAATIALYTTSVLAHTR